MFGPAVVPAVCGPAGPLPQVAVEVVRPHAMHCDYNTRKKRRCITRASLLRWLIAIQTIQHWQSHSLTSTYLGGQPLSLNLAASA